MCEYAIEFKTDDHRINSNVREVNRVLHASTGVTNEAEVAD